MIAMAMTILAGSAVPALGQADSTPAPSESDAAPSGASDASANLAASPENSPVLAQGLIYLTGDDVFWQVREIELASPAVAESVTGNARFVYQQSGASVIRNDVTGKRARLEVGEAYFMSAGDPYTSMAADDSLSVVWVFEIANDDEVGDGAFYLSPDVAGIAEGVYDFEFFRDVLDSGESTGFMSQGGPSLIMVLSGQVAVSDGEGAATLAAGDGRIVEGNATIQAEGDEQAVYVVAGIGADVSDASAAVPDAAPAAPAEAAPAPAPAAESTDPSVPGIDPADVRSGESIAEEIIDAAGPIQQGGEYVTSISVAAAAPVTISVIVDGVSVFDGYLEAGESTSWFTGSVFEVYTTSGVNTEFTNTCSDVPFLMGYEEGDAYYVLTANASSCAPVE